MGAVLIPLTPLAIGGVVAGIGQFTASEKLRDGRELSRGAPDIAMLLDLRRELHLSA
jgi:hypothetical protein